MGDGGLVADLHGLTFGENIPETTLLDWQFNPFHELLPRNEATRTEARASWTAPARIGCRPEDVLPDGVTAKDQIVARRAAEAAAAPPPRPVRSTGRPKPVSGPSVAHRLAFTGAWDTTVEGGIGYQLILQPQGNNNGIGPSGIEVPLEVVGTFLYNRFGDIAVKPGEHSNNGNLRGVIAPYARTLVFTYVQHNGSAGSGSFMLSDDGQSITGSIENSGGKSTWNGTRRSEAACWTGETGVRTMKFMTGLLVALAVLTTAPSAEARRVWPGHGGWRGAVDGRIPAGKALSAGRCQRALYRPAADRLRNTLCRWHLRTPRAIRRSSWRKWRGRCAVGVMPPECENVRYYYCDRFR